MHRIRPCSYSNYILIPNVDGEPEVEERDTGTKGKVSLVTTPTA